MTKEHKAEKKLLSWLKATLFSGLLVWLPLVVTFLVVRFIIDLLDGSLLLLPARYQPDNLLGFHLPGTGVVLSILVVLGTGILIANFVGRTLVHWWENLLSQIPLVKSVYTAVKQVIETIGHSNGTAFSKVYLIQWPRENIWSIGFQTTESHPKMRALVDGELVNLFIPTTPNITSGFLMIVDKSQLKEVDLTVEQAVKLVISLGVVQPPVAATDVEINKR